MCTFVTASLDIGADAERAAHEFEEASRRLSPLLNPTVEKHLGRDRRYYSTTLLSCDCGTPLASARFERLATHEHGKVSRELLKKRRAGWSDAKVERWLHDKRHARAAQRSSHRRGEEEELEKWVELIHRVLARSAKEVGLLVHEYSGGLSDPLELKEPVRFSAAAVDCQFLRELELDRFHFILSE